MPTNSSPSPAGNSTVKLSYYKDQHTVNVMPVIESK